jgi:D-sedoheptulose 7-phosphate isomerase
VDPRRIPALTMDLLGCAARDFEESLQVHGEAATALGPGLVQAAELVTRQLLAERKVLACGNGASAALAQLFAAKMVNRFETERIGLPALAISADACSVTAIANEYHLDEVYARQVRALGQVGDILLAISTGGDSGNVVAAVEAAHEREMQVILLTGRDGGRASTALAGGDIELRAPARAAPRIHEVHLLALHCLCHLVDAQLFGRED